MPSQRKEYVSKLELSVTDVNKMLDAQLAILDNGFKTTNKGSLQSGLVTAATILSLVFIAPTAVTLAAGVVSLMGSFPSERTMCINLCDKGVVGIARVQSYLRNNKPIKRVRVKFPFLEFVNEKFRIVQGNGLITEVYDGKVWY